MNHIVDANKKVGTDHPERGLDMVKSMAKAMEAKRAEMIARPLRDCYEAMAQAAYEVSQDTTKMDGETRIWYPDDNPNWREHTPGAPMPCEGDQRIAILTAGLRKKAIEPLTIVTERGVARRFVWREDWGDGTIVAWRPAEEGE
ncbi:hypothetical protein ACT6QG_05345 [Xanthobacter sp. TB0136]|uniref:hypothetical protein n=1 Tax=Xanthobacter sp. TB0136 TaxID=3459177 RepID=UPI0040399F7C